MLSHSRYLAGIDVHCSRVPSGLKEVSGARVDAHLFFACGRDTLAIFRFFRFKIARKPSNSGMFHHTYVRLVGALAAAFGTRNIAVRSVDPTTVGFICVVFVWYTCHSSTKLLLDSSRKRLVTQH